MCKLLILNPITYTKLESQINTIPNFNSAYEHAYALPAPSRNRATMSVSVELNNFDSNFIRNLKNKL